MANVADRPYFERVAVMDLHTRPKHAALNGFTARADDPVWEFLYTPDGYHCRCRIRARSASDVEKYGLTVQSSEGRLVEVEQEYGQPGQDHQDDGAEDAGRFRCIPPTRASDLIPVGWHGSRNWKNTITRSARQYVTGTLDRAGFCTGAGERQRTGCAPAISAGHPFTGTGRRHGRCAADGKPYS